MVDPASSPPVLWPTWPAWLSPEWFGPLRPLLWPAHLDGAATGAALDVLIAIATGAAVLWLLPALRRSERPVDAVESRGAGRPLAAFFLVCLLLFANQVLVNVYILRSHGGDPSFVTRYLGSGWFVLATSSAVVRYVNAHLPAAIVPHLPYAILRVNAALELPFVITAYLAIAALLSPPLARALRRSALLPLALVIFTATFCLIEMRLWNPWTLSDLVWRWAACGVGVVLWGLSRLVGEPAALPPIPGSAARLLVLFLGGGALAAGVLLLYDVTLLYNLGHLPRLALPLTACALLAVGAANLRAQAARHEPGPGLSGGSALLAVFTVVFFVPSLAIRYAGVRHSAVVAAAVLGTVALLGAVPLCLRAVSPRQRAAGWPLLGLILFAAGGAALAAADWQGWLTLPRLPAPYDVPMLELRLLRAAVLFLAGGGVAAALLDGALWLASRLRATR